MPATGQSRMAAILFTDLVGSTELLSRLGEPAFDGLRRAHFAILGRAVEKAGGQQVKGTGDGVLAVFESAASAVSCAVAMQQAVDLHSRTGVPLAIRVGLALGDVSFEDRDVYGAPVVEAARLVAAAHAGQILATAIVRGVAGTRSAAEFSDVGCLELKGLPVPVPTCEVAWEPLRLSAVPLPSLLTDIDRIFVGRAVEFDRLERSWDAARGGERRTVVLAGEPGVGKTRLAAELAARVHSGGATVLAGRCDEDLGVPYQPFVEALRHFVDHVPAEDLGTRLGRYGGELARLVPELNQRVPDLPPPLTSDPETERYRLFDAVASWLATACAAEPLLLVLDDLQWAAKPTLLLLRHVVQSPDPGRLLVLGTYRDTDLGHDHPLVEVVADLRRRIGVERVSLAGLDTSGVAAFMEQAAGHELDRGGIALARVIHEETEGNPFFVRETVRHLTEIGAIEREEGRWTTRLRIEELGIPESVRDVVGRRLTRLSDGANRVLHTAAVVGTEFELPVLQAAGGLGDEALLSAVEEAVRARLVAETSATRCRFSHAVVRATLYERLTAARRVSLHRRVGTAIETVHAGALDDHLPALAHHWARASAPGGDTARAVDYAARAGDRALAQLAHDEAGSYYRQALHLLDGAGGPRDDGRRLELLIALGEAQRRAGDVEHRATLLAAAHLAQVRGDRDGLARAALANNRGARFGVVGGVDAERVAVLESALEALGPDGGATRARLLANLALELIWAGDRERRVRLSDEALDIARRVDDPATLAHVLANRALVIAGPTTLRERLANSAELVALSEGLGDPFMASQVWSVRFRAAMEATDLDEADRCLAACERLASQLRQPVLKWLATMMKAGRALLAGDIESAERRIEDALEVGVAAGQPDAPALFAYQRLRIRREQGRLREAMDDLAGLRASLPRLAAASSLQALAWAELDEDERAREIYDQLASERFARVPVDLTWLQAITDCAVVCAHLDDTAGATTLIELLAPLADQMPVVAMGMAGGCVSHYLGLLATTVGDVDGAQTRFASAEATHLRIGAPTWVARTRLEWARMLLTRGGADDMPRARELLTGALGTARRFGLGTVERRAVELLGRAGHQRG